MPSLPKLLTLAVATTVLAACNPVKDMKFIAATEAESEGDTRGALALNLDLAESDEYPSAKLDVARAYLEGDPVKQDMRKGIYWLERAAQSRDRFWRNSAKVELGRVYYGDFDPDYRDLSRAYEIWSECAAEGDRTCTDWISIIEDHPAVYVAQRPELFRVTGQQRLREPLEQGEFYVVNGDLANGVAIIESHARAGNAKAQNLLGEYHYYQTKDQTQAWGWTWLAAQNGNLTAMHRMGMGVYQGAFAGDDKEATYWFSKASRAGYADSTNALGVVAANPFKGVADHAKAVRYFTQAAEQGSVDALVNLGDSYLVGNGVARSSADARRFYEMAASQGNLPAANKLSQHFGVGFEEATGLPPTATRGSLPAPASPKAPVERSLIDLFATTSPSVHAITAIRFDARGEVQVLGGGSAVSITDSIAATNAHVVEGAEIVAIIPENRNADPILWKVLAVDKELDLALIGTGTQNYPPVTDYVPSNELRIGQKVFTIGSPQGLTNTLSEGIVSGVRREGNRTVVQITAPISQGSSGGGVFDLDGRLIGITTFQLDGSGELNFAVSVENLLEFAMASAR